MKPYSIVSAVNDPGVLESCLLKSPCIGPQTQPILQWGHPSAAAAYNNALDRATTDIIIFVHQDVYLPAGWAARLEAALEWLSEEDPSWGVLGVCGRSREGHFFGWVYSTGLGRVLGGPFSTPAQVRTLDEVLLIIRKSSGLRFDENLDGFHMYGTDICLEAERRGHRNYVIPCFLIHNSNGIKQLPAAFWRAFLRTRSKWRRNLPIYSPCAELRRSSLQAAWQIAGAIIRSSLRSRAVGKRIADPAYLYNYLKQTGALSSLQEDAFNE